MKCVEERELIGRADQRLGIGLFEPMQIHLGKSGIEQLQHAIQSLLFGQLFTSKQQVWPAQGFRIGFPIKRCLVHASIIAHRKARHNRIFGGF